MTALETLRQLKRQQLQARYPNCKPDYLALPIYTDRTANGLTRCVIDFLNLSGHQAERISNQGRVIDQRKSYVDTAGFSRTIGSIKRIPSSGTKGTSDISAIINSLSIKIEVKIGRDKQSPEQANYQHKIESAGGVYLIAHDFAQFFEWYNEFTSK